MKIRAKIVSGMVVVFFLVSVLVFGSVARAEMTLLKLGSRGDKVRELQQYLINLGFLQGKADGIFGPVTRKAVINFQKTKGLVPDGIAGPKTLKALYNSQSASSGDITSRGWRTLKKGDRGADVEQIQRRLNELGFNCGPVDGIFGNKVYKAVVKFQKANGLVPDGIVGSRTREKLFGSRSEAQEPDSNSNEDSTFTKSSYRLGDRGPEVEKIQKALKDLGYFKYDKITGYYGPITEQAVMWFQSVNELKVDGIAGKNTLSKLYSGNAKKAEGQGPPSELEDINDRSSEGEDASVAQDVITFAKKYLGRPYKYGASGPDAFDCTGFTCYVFKHFGIDLPRSAKDQGYKNYAPKVSRKDLKPGDLVFFNTIKSDGDLSDHAGIYIGDGKFIHCSSSKKYGAYVRISTLDSGFYQRVFSWGRRVLR